MEILLTLSPYLLPLVSGILSILGILLARKAMEYLGIKRTVQIDAMIDKAVDVATDWAEVAGTTYLHSQGQKMPSTSKQAKALNVALDELKRVGVTDVAKEAILTRIESSLLKKGLKPGEPSDPKA